jgi:hypothetical protein
MNQDEAEMKHVAPITFLIISILVSRVPAEFYLGADAGINSLAGMVCAITVDDDRLYTMIHLDLENSKAGYAGLAYRIPAKIGFVPLGIACITAGQQNKYQAAFGLYTGFQADVSKNVMVYIDYYYTPTRFQHRRVQFSNVDIGMSFAIFSIVGGLFSSGNTAE